MDAFLFYSVFLMNMNELERLVDDKLIKIISPTSSIFALSTEYLLLLEEDLHTVVVYSEFLPDPSVVPYDLLLQQILSKMDASVGKLSEYSVVFFTSTFCYSDFLYFCRSRWCSSSSWMDLDASGLLGSR